MNFGIHGDWSGLSGPHRFIGPLGLWQWIMIESRKGTSTSVAQMNKVWIKNSTMNLKMFRVAYLGITMNLSKSNQSKVINRLSKSDSKLNFWFKFSPSSGQDHFSNVYLLNSICLKFSKVIKGSTLVCSPLSDCPDSGRWLGYMVFRTLWTVNDR